MKYNSIILSGVPVSGKSTLARKLSGIYNFPICSPGQLWRDDWKRLHTDGKVSFEEFWQGTTIEDNLKMDRRTRSVFEKGHVIGDVRYSIHCKDLPALLVLVVADLDIRARRGLNTDRYKGKSFEEVRQILVEREKDEVKVGQDMYGTDYDYRDPKHYHLTLNSGLLTTAEEASIITASAQTILS